MNPHSRYAYEKLSLALNYLTVGGGDIRERLKLAHAEFHPIGPSDFPEHLQADWVWIRDQLSRFGPVRHADGTIWIGAVDNTLERIKKSTGVKIAERIVRLHAELGDYLKSNP